MHAVTLKKWGNSIGFVLPAQEVKKAQAYVGEKFTVVGKENGSFLLEPVTDPQEGWLDAFNKVALQKEDLAWTNQKGTQFDEEEWQW